MTLHLKRCQSLIFVRTYKLTCCFLIFGVLLSFLTSCTISHPNDYKFRGKWVPKSELGLLRVHEDTKVVSVDGIKYAYPGNVLFKPGQRTIGFYYKRTSKTSVGYNTKSIRTVTSPTMYLTFTVKGGHVYELFSSFNPENRSEFWGSSDDRFMRPPGHMQRIIKGKSWGFIENITDPNEPKVHTKGSMF